MNDLATLGQRMRHFRTAAGLTLDQLGADVGVAASQLSLMENGKREPRLSLLGAIAEGRFAPTENVVFLHTGGSVGLFGYRDAFTTP